MKVKLFSKPIKDYSARVMACLNRGIDPKEIQSYLHNNDQDIYLPDAFDKELLHKGATMLMTHIAKEDNAIIIVDSDVDGWTSAALMINYLYKCFPAWTENHLTWSLHQGKEHGLKDHIDMLLESNYSLVICPDSATNDIKEIAKLHENGTDVLILDHHISDVPFSEYAVTINSQYNYPNKDLSGVGVVYKFCQYLDILGGNDYAEDFIDLVAIGLMGDMMDIRSLETKELIFKGLRDENIRNPLIAGLVNKNEFALSKADYAPSPHNNLRITPMGAAFFIIPFLNALSRSGTMEEKLLVFESMLTMRAFEEILSNKRGHKLGEMEKRVEQALRTCTNVKNRQTRAETAGMELLTSQAEQMLDNKVLVFCLEPGEIDPNIAGLVANKLMSKYQRPVCVTTRSQNEIHQNDEENDWIRYEDVYQGSMRGYTATGIDDFKSVAETSPSCNWVRGHENAAGISLSDPGAFVDDMNEKLKNVSTDIVYYVDYTWSAEDVDGDKIIELSELNDYLGTGFARPQVHIKSFTITPDNFKVMKSNTLKFTLPNGIDIIKFDGSEDEIEVFSSGDTTIECVCKCNINEWNWERNPQLIMLDYEIQDKIYDWGF